MKKDNKKQKLEEEPDNERDPKEKKIKKVQKHVEVKGPKKINYNAYEQDED